MLRRIVGWVVLVPLCLVLIAFGLANTQRVNVYFNPLGSHAADVDTGIPLFFLLFGVLLFGVVLGGVATWFSQRHHRRDERSFRRETERLNREVDAMRRSPVSAIDDMAKS
jgi:uncharacterized integral membrane protein